MKIFTSDISKKVFPTSEKISGNTIRKSLLVYIQKEFPLFSESDYISESELNNFRKQYISDFLKKEVGELDSDELTLLNSLQDHTTLSDKIEEDEGKDESTIGEKIADKVASFGGSWRFIIIFLAFLALWIIFNIYILEKYSFDPYPFTFLNLALSFIAALQAPVIMMSQNRQSEKDRERAKKAYIIDFKAEIEIRALHEKVDHLMINQQQDLFDSQKIQIEMLQDIISKMENK